MAARDLYALVAGLTQRVEYLEDELVKQKRENANLMEQMTDISESGVSSSLVGKIENKFSEVLQTEDEIRMTVADLSDEATKKFSEFEMTAEDIRFEVTELNDEVSTNADNISALELKANGITSTVTKIYGATQAVTSKSEMTDKNVMYHCNGAYYYFSEITDDWEAVDTKSVVSQLIQTKDGFILAGDVKISGDQIVDGVATARNGLNIGDPNTYTEQKQIVFNNMAMISTVYAYDGISPQGYQNGLSFSASYMKFNGIVDFSGATVTGLYAVFA